MAHALWGLTTFFNPSSSPLRLRNYESFRKESQRQGLPLVTVELAFGDAPFCLLEGRDAEILIQRRSDSILWQKERLLNLALRALPEECTQVCWIDADILFEDDDWIAETSHLLGKHLILQPYSACIRLPSGGTVDQFPGAALEKEIFQGNDEATYSKSVCSRMSGFRKRFSGSTGYVWCARRALLDEVGFYDRCIVGGGDREMALAVLYAPGKVPSQNIRSFCPRLRSHLGEWHRRVHQIVRRRVGFRPGVIHHLFHSASQDRKYAERHQILLDCDFDPETDVLIDQEGCLQFAPDRAELARLIGSYFDNRREALPPNVGA